MKKRRDTYRILAKDKWINNNTWVTGINNNDLIIGVSGSGKTRGYVKPNLMCASESIIVADTKGTLFREFGSSLEKEGYQVWMLDFVDMVESPMGYNPLSAIRYDEETDSYNEQDIMMIAAAVCPIETGKEPYWDYATRMQVEAMIAYVMEALPEREHHFGSVAKVASLLGSDVLQRMFQEWEAVKPDSVAVRKWRMFEKGKEAKTTQSCIQLIIAEKLNDFITAGAMKFAQHPLQIDFAELGRKKTAVFLNVSDMDRSQDKFLNLVYTQAFHTLCRSADKDYGDGRLKVPVRIILDDFAANTVIPDFDKIISVIRSREIYVSIILQSITQLNSMYGTEKARTIINNCDNCLYLGGQDVETARYISIKLNRPINTILDMPVNEAYLFTRGQKPCRVEKLSETPLETTDFLVR